MTATQQIINANAQDYVTNHVNAAITVVSILVILLKCQ